MTEKDKKIMAQWRKEFPKWDSSKISFWVDELGDYIGFEIVPWKILKMDRENFPEWLFDWKNAMKEVNKQWKRLPTGDKESQNPEENEWQSMIDLMPGGDQQYFRLVLLANLCSIYWSSSDYAELPKTTAWTMDFTDNHQSGRAKTIKALVRCVR